MKRKRISAGLTIFSLAFFLLLGVAGVAQPNKSYPSPKQFAQHCTMQMRDKLSLTPEQEQQLYDINLRFAENCYRNMGDAGQLKQLQEERKAALRTVLSSEQYQHNQAMYEQNANYYNQTCWGPYWGMGSNMLNGGGCMP